MTASDAHPPGESSAAPIGRRIAPRPARLQRSAPRGGSHSYRRPPNVKLAAFSISCLLILMIAGPYMTLKTLPYTGEGSPLRQVIYIALFLCVAMAARVGDQPSRLLAIPFTLALTLGWCWLSLTWAVAPDVAVRRLLLTTIVIMSIFMAVDLIGSTRTLRLMRTILVLVLAVNYAAAVLAPSIGTHEAVSVEGFGLDPDLIGNWKGVLEQKNFAGAVCALTIMLFVFDARAIPKWFRAAVIVASAYFLYRTHAKTSFGILAISIVAGAIFLTYNPRYRFLLFLGAAMTIFFTVTFGFIYWDAIAEPFRRPDAFTGRVQIWSVMMAYWQDHWLGSGYGSFWNVGDDSPLYRYTKTGSWVSLVAIGHNGYLDLLVQTGLPGLVLAIAAAVVAPLIKLFTSLKIPRQRGALLFAFQIFCAGHNLTETSLLDRDAIIQIMWMLTIAMIGVETRLRSAPRAHA
ncbi:O-antigen ligase family protein [Terrarubrum flagellatum]|uniref:O-antigen ligase family protein n=1 Tax=Terrirubrum flagellatum TaxID=2895980 RepID=UPI00314538EB